MTCGVEVLRVAQRFKKVIHPELCVRLLDQSLLTCEIWKRDTHTHTKETKQLTARREGRTLAVKFEDQRPRHQLVG